jgi:ketosteroid isomerase-like protein
VTNENTLFYPPLNIKIMKVLSSYLTAIAITLVFLSCGDTERADTVRSDSAEVKADPEKEASNIRQQVSAFTEEFKRGDTFAMAARYSSDALVMPPNSQVIRNNDIASFWAGAMKMGIKNMRLDIQDVSGNGEWMIETGNYEMYGDNNNALDKGKYVAVWKKENGTWKMYRDIWNTSMPSAKK